MIVLGWTPDRVETLKQLWADGLSASQIARALGGGVSRNAVISKVHRLGCEGRPAPWRPAFVPRAPRPMVHRTRPAAAPKVDRRKFGPGPPRALTSGQPMPPLREVAPTVDPRHWLTRKFGECTWVVSGQGADAFSCCAPIAAGASWCPAHKKIGTTIGRGAWASTTELIRSVRRFA